MSVTVQAVYAGGVLRPVQPLALPEGATVEVTVSTAETIRPQIRPPTPEEADYTRRVKAVRSLEELFAALATAPPLPPGYDLSQALNANRQASGERPLFPEGPEGSNR
jgi:predicted DNA-binding antitoxin AbrB/MazE fold protein